MKSNQLAARYSNHKDPSIAYETVLFNSKTISTGRNGNFYSIALYVREYTPLEGDPRTVSLIPVTSKGKLANCCISVPVVNIKDLIKALQEMLP